MPRGTSRRRPHGNPFGYDKQCMPRSLNIAAWLRRASQGAPRKDAGFRVIWIPRQDDEQE